MTTVMPVKKPVQQKPVSVPQRPTSEELAAELTRLEREEQEREDRRRTEELARLRAVQRFD